MGRGQSRPAGTGVRAEGSPCPCSPPEAGPGMRPLGSAACVASGTHLKLMRLWLFCSYARSSNKIFWSEVREGQLRKLAGDTP